MADTNVHITGAESGSFLEAFNGLPPWATENTAVKIQGILNKMYSLHEKTFVELVKRTNSAGLSPAEMKKGNDEIEKYVKNVHKENEQIPKKKKERQEVEEGHKKQLFNWKNVTSRITGFNFALLTLEGAAIAIAETLKENFNTYTKLNEAGINMISGFDGVSDGFKGVQQLTALTGVKFTDLAETMTKYSTAVNAFSAGKFAKAVGKASSQLGQFGYTTKEGAELIGGMLEAQRHYTDVGLKSDQQVSDEAVRLGKNIFRLSMATGMARSQILANMEALAASTDANIYAGQVGDQTATEMTAFLGSFKNQKIGQQILAMLSAPIKPLNQTFMNLQKVGMGGFATSFINFNKSLEGMPKEMREQALKSYIAAHRGELEANKQRLATLALAGVEGAEAANEFIIGLTQSADAIKPLTKQEIEDQEKTNKARAAFTDQWNILTSKLQSVFAPSIGMINMLTKGLEYLNEGIDWVVDVFKGLVTDAQPVIDNLTMFGSFLSDVASNEDLIAFFQGVGVVLKILWKDVLVPVVAGILDIGEELIAFVGMVFTGFGMVGTWLGNTVGAMVIGIQDGWDLFSKAWDDMVSSFKGAWDFVVDTIKSAAEALLHPFKAIGNALGIGGGEAKETPAGSAGKPAETKETPAGSAGKPAETKISVPKDPNPSTIDSPSATKPTGFQSTDPDADRAKQDIRSIGREAHKENPAPDLNDHLQHHGDLLSTIADGISNLVSTNKDILKYSKIS